MLKPVKTSKCHKVKIANWPAQDCTCQMYYLPNLSTPKAVIIIPVRKVSNTAKAEPFVT